LTYKELSENSNRLCQCVATPGDARRFQHDVNFINPARIYFGPA
jgi:hypothetical protein